MRTREKSYNDYNLSDDEVKKAFSFCRGPDFTSIDMFSLLSCAQDVYPDLTYDICYSIRYGVSYERMDAARYMDITKDSFYGYRRKAIAKFWHMKTT